jgi:triacylglycerol esterase/lipase EstA (alpha/beta hydrolase family)
MRWSPFADLAPRRRLLVLGTALVVAALVIGGVLRAVVTSPDRPDRPAQGTPGPVLLVPGYGGGQGALSQLAARIRATGRDATVVSLPGDGTGDLAAQADALRTAADRALAAGGSSVDVIGYSAGGVVVRLWVAERGGATVARRVVTLGSPLHGARIAAVGAVTAPDACPVACQQLVPGSSLLRQLDRAPVPARLPWLSVWTTDDETVTPPDSARLDGARNVPVQSLCPSARVSHGALPTDPVVTALVLGAIGTAPLSAPVAVDCG